MNADPVVPKPDSQGQNRYAYVHNNPIKFTDPSGNVPQEQAQPQEEAPQEQDPFQLIDIVDQYDYKDQYTVVPEFVTATSELEIEWESLRDIQLLMFGARESFAYAFRWDLGFPDLVIFNDPHTPISRSQLRAFEAQSSRYITLNSMFHSDMPFSGGLLARVTGFEAAMSQTPSVFSSRAFPLLSDAITGFHWGGLTLGAAGVLGGGAGLAAYSGESDPIIKILGQTSGLLEISGGAAYATGSYAATAGRGGTLMSWGSKLMRVGGGLAAVTLFIDMLNDMIENPPDNGDGTARRMQAQGAPSYLYKEDLKEYTPEEYSGSVR